MSARLWGLFPCFLEKTVDLFSPQNMAGYVATALFALLNLALTFLIVKFLLCKPLKRVLDRRRQLVDDLLASQRRQLEEAKLLKDGYAEKLNSAQTEVREMLERSKENLRRTEQEKRSALQEELSSRRRQAERELALYEAKELGEKQAEVVDLSMRLLKGLLPSLSPRDCMSQIVEDAKRELKDEPADRPSDENTRGEKAAREKKVHKSEEEKL